MILYMLKGFQYHEPSYMAEDTINKKLNEDVRLGR